MTMLFFNTENRIYKTFRNVVVSCAMGLLVCASSMAQELKTESSETAEIDHLALFLSNYLAQNLLDRTDISRRLIDRAELEKYGRLPSKSLYKSLGYRLRKSFVAMPPPLESKPFTSNDDALNSAVLEDLELSWALLDSTLMRLQSAGLGRNASNDWAIALTRKNLLQEGVNYWYQLGRQGRYSDWLLRLKLRTNDLFEGIAQARQNYDVQDLQDQELALLDLRADNASLFQYFSSEQARLYNRTSKRDIPEQAVDMNETFNRALTCSNQNGTSQLGQQYLSQQEAVWLSLQNSQVSSDKAQVYELSELARRISRKALEIHAKRTTHEYELYSKALKEAQSLHNNKLTILKQAHALLTEQGQVVDSQEIKQLESKKILVNRQRLTANRQERELAAAVRVLADKVALEILRISQKRLGLALSKDQPLFAFSKVATWQRSSHDAQMVRALLLSVHKLSFVDYLLAHERAAFINLSMLRSCAVGSKVASFTMGTPLDVMSDVSRLAKGFHFAQEHSFRSLKIQALAEHRKEFKNLELAFLGEELGDSYELPDIKEELVKRDAPALNSSPVVVTGPSELETNPDEVKSKLVIAPSALNNAVEENTKIGSNEAAPAINVIGYEKAKQRLAKYNIKLATKSEVLKAAEGHGYTLQVVTAPQEKEIARVLNKLVFEEPFIVYRSKRKRSKEMVYKLIIGFSPDYDDLDRLRAQLKTGWIKPFRLVRSDALN